MLRKSALLLIMFMIASLCSAQQFQNIGCKQSSPTGSCVKCLDRYYLQEYSQICFPVSPLCNTYNNQSGACTSCYVGFVLINTGACMRVQAIKVLVPHCMVYSVQGKCLQCQNAYQAAANGENCYIAYPECAIYDIQTGICTQCAQGYKIGQDMKCYQILIKNCLIQKSGVCSQCSKGFVIENGVCYLPLIQNVENCQSYLYGVCQKCRPQYLLGLKNNCIKQSPLCSKYSSKGQCEACEPGFILFQGYCLIENTQASPLFDPFCSVFDSQVCLKCSYGYYFNEYKRCTMANPFCKTFNQNNGKCLTCYSGYKVIDSNCVRYYEQFDPNCHIFEGNKCVKCSQGAYFGSQGKCLLKDLFCKEINQIGKCVACYPGYIQNTDGKCEINKNFNCFQWKNGACQQCSKGYFLDTDGKCKLINPLCKIFDHANSKCVKCYSGYVLHSGQCTQMSQFVGQLPYDINCSQLDLSGSCLNCFNRFYLKNGKCRQVSPYCKTYENTKGYCLTCYKGYKVDFYGACVLDI